MWALTLMSFACSSLLIGRTACDNICSARSSEPEYRYYEIALGKSINKLIQDMRGGYPRLGMQIANFTSFEAPNTFTLNKNNGKISLDLQNMTASGFIDLFATHVLVEPQNLRNDITTWIALEIPSILVEAELRLNGTWMDNEYDETGRLNIFAETVTCTVLIAMALDDDRQFWTITELRMEKQHVNFDKVEIYFGNDNLDNSGIARKGAFKTKIISKIKALLLRHLKPQIREFLQKLLSKFRWYAVIFGKFYPTDPELYGLYGRK